MTKKQYEEYVRVRTCTDSSNEKCPSMHGQFQTNPAENSFARTPWKVLADPELSDRDVRVYGGMATLERGGLVTSGVRWIAAACNQSKTETANSIQVLSRHGHVTIRNQGRGKRCEYVLTAHIFTKRSRGRSETFAVAETKDFLTCPRCKKNVKVVAKTGICYSCQTDDTRMEKYQAARARLGPNATHAEITALLQTDADNKRWRRIARKAGVAA